MENEKEETSSSDASTPPNPSPTHDHNYMTSLNGVEKKPTQKRSSVAQLLEEREKRRQETPTASTNMMAANFTLNLTESVQKVMTALEDEELVNGDLSPASKKRPREEGKNEGGGGTGRGKRRSESPPSAD